MHSVQPLSVYPPTQPKSCNRLQDPDSYYLATPTITASTTTVSKGLEQSRNILSRLLAGETGMTPVSSWYVIDTQNYSIYVHIKLNYSFYKRMQGHFSRNEFFLSKCLMPKESTANLLYVSGSLLIICTLLRRILIYVFRCLWFVLVRRAR